MHTGYKWLSGVWEPGLDHSEPHGLSSVPAPYLLPSSLSHCLSPRHMQQLSDWPPDPQSLPLQCLSHHCQMKTPEAELEHYRGALLLRAFHDFPLPAEHKCLSLAFKAFCPAASSTSCLQVLSTQPRSGAAFCLKHLIPLPSPGPLRALQLLLPSSTRLLGHLFCFEFSYLAAMMNLCYHTVIASRQCQKRLRLTHTGESFTEHL